MSNDEDIPEYNDIGVDEDEEIQPDTNMDNIAEHVDYLKQQKKQQLMAQMQQYNDEENIDLPDDPNMAAHKYDISADISPQQQKDFDESRIFYGRHVVNSNTLRKDNPRHLLEQDAVEEWGSMPQFSTLADRTRKKVVAEFQMTRGNEERGGFDRKLQRSVLKREDVDIKNAQTLSNLSKTQKKGMLSFLRRKK